MADVPGTLWNLDRCAPAIGEIDVRVGSREEPTDRQLSGFDCALQVRPAEPAVMAISALTIGLIDEYRFSRECLSDALEGLQPNLAIRPFDTIEGCIAGEQDGFDLIVFYLHASGPSDTASLQKVSAVAAAFPAVPLVVLSDAEDAQQLKTVRNTLKRGARGVISTRDTGLSVAVAAIRLVTAGGTFAPMEVLLSSRADRTLPPPDPARQMRLTSRQMVVLSHIERGHANKTIAYQLSMSESTVKVHVRNIMRKVGATNRTQAVYMAQKIWEGVGIAKAPDASS